MRKQSKPYLPAVLSFAAWIVLSYMIGLSRRNIDLPANHLVGNITIYAIVGAVYGLCVWFIILRPDMAPWLKGALLFPAIGFCYYFFNTGLADIEASLLCYCMPVGLIAGTIFGVLTRRTQAASNNLAKEHYLERERD